MNRPTEWPGCSLPVDPKLAFWPTYRAEHSLDIGHRLLRSFLRRNGTDPGDDGIDIGRRHLAVVDVPRHRQVEGTAVAIDTFRQRLLDLGVGPGADAFSLCEEMLAALAWARVLKMYPPLPCQVL